MAYKSLSKTVVRSASKPPGRAVWKTQSTLATPRWAAIFLDAEIYLERVQAMSVIQHLEEIEQIPPAVAVFVSNESAHARHTDFTCDPEYGIFLSNDIVSWLLKEHPEVHEHLVVIGLSLSGLAAAHAALTNPAPFRGAICQSPSFWWDDERFRTSLPQGTIRSAAFWISVGDQEIEHDVSHPPSGMFQRFSQIEACKRCSDALAAVNYHVNYRVFEGGHDPTCWREDLVGALPWAAALP